MSSLELLADGQQTKQTTEALAWSVEDAELTPRESLREDDRRLLDRLAYQYGSAPESYDVLISDGSLLFTPCGQGAVGVLPQGRYWHIPGGILAPDELKQDIIFWLQAISRARSKTLIMYSIAEEDLPLFREAGFEINLLGAEPTMPLGEIDWSGPEHRWVRRQTSYCQRAGLEVVEIRDDAARQKLAGELLDVLNEDLAGRAFPRPLRLLEGEFDPYRLYRRRLFVARRVADGTVQGFLACSPMQGGSAWSFETYRKRNGAPRGTIAFLFREVIDRLQAEGVRSVSLCLVPGKGVREDDFRDGSRLVQQTLSLWYERMGFLFNIRGQEHFKSRFRPTEQRRYTCVSARSSVWSLLSFLWTTGAVFPHPLNVTRNVLRSLRRRRR